MDEIDGHDITIEEAHGEIIGARAARDWNEKIEQATRLLADLPQRAMIEEPEAFLEVVTISGTRVPPVMAPHMLCGRCHSRRMVRKRVDSQASTLTRPLGINFEVQQGLGF